MDRMHWDTGIVLRRTRRVDAVVAHEESLGRVQQDEVHEHGPLRVGVEVLEEGQALLEDERDVGADRCLFSATATVRWSLELPVERGPPVSEGSFTCTARASRGALAMMPRWDSRRSARILMQTRCRSSRFGG